MPDEAVSSMMGRVSQLHEMRLDHVVRRIKASGARNVLDLGCGSGQLLYRLAAEPQFRKVVGLEHSPYALARARELLADHAGSCCAELTLINGSYTDSQPDLCGYDAAAMVETIEHIKPDLLSNVERVVFEQMHPRVIFLTTPNREYNPLYGLNPGEFREADHKFEWDRDRFGRWVRGIAARTGYRVVIGSIGDADPDLGAPTQTALFTSLRASTAGGKRYG